MNVALLVSHILLWIVVLLLVLLMAATVRQVGLLHRRIPPIGARTGTAGPQIGDEAPPLEALDLSGRQATLGSARGRKTLLIFISPRCKACAEIAPAIRSIAKSERSTTETVLISDGSAETLRRYLRDLGLAHLPAVASTDLQERYEVMMSPYALFVDQFGKVRAKGIVNSLEQFESLIRVDELESENARFGHQRADSEITIRSRGRGDVDARR